MRKRGEEIDRERLGDMLILFLSPWPYSHTMGIFTTNMEPSMRLHKLKMP